MWYAFYNEPLSNSTVYIIWKYVYAQRYGDLYLVTKIHFTKYQTLEIMFTYHSFYHPCFSVVYYRVIQHRPALSETIYRGTTLLQWSISFSMYKVLWTSQIKAKKMKMEMFYSCIQNLYNLHCYEIIYHSNIGILATNIWARNFQLIFVSALKTFVLGGVNLLQNFHNLNYLK